MLIQKSAVICENSTVVINSLGSSSVFSESLCSQTGKCSECYMSNTSFMKVILQFSSLQHAEEKQQMKVHESVFSGQPRNKYFSTGH